MHDFDAVEIQRRQGLSCGLHPHLNSFSLTMLLMPNYCTSVCTVFDLSLTFFTQRSWVAVVGRYAVHKEQVRSLV